MMGKLYRLRAILLVVGSLLVSNANGAIVHRQFEIVFDTGALTGSAFPGSLSYNDTHLTGLGTEFLGPTGGLFAMEGALTFDVTIGPDTFQLEDDSFAPHFPEFQFFDGEFIDVGYTALLFTSPYPAFLDILGGTATYISRHDEESEGRWVLNETAVPDENVGLAALALCVAGLILTNRRDL